MKYEIKNDQIKIKEKTTIFIDICDKKPKSLATKELSSIFLN